MSPPLEGDLDLTLETPVGRSGALSPRAINSSRRPSRFRLERLKRFTALELTLLIRIRGSTRKGWLTPPPPVLPGFLQPLSSLDLQAWQSKPVTPTPNAARGEKTRPEKVTATQVLPRCLMSFCQSCADALHKNALGPRTWKKCRSSFWPLTIRASELFDSSNPSKCWSIICFYRGPLTPLVWLGLLEHILMH